MSAPIPALERAGERDGEGCSGFLRSAYAAHHAAVRAPKHDTLSAARPKFRGSVQPSSSEEEIGEARPGWSAISVFPGRDFRHSFLPSLAQDLRLLRAAAAPFARERSSFALTFPSRSIRKWVRGKRSTLRRRSEAGSIRDCRSPGPVLRVRPDAAAGTRE